MITRTKHSARGLWLWHSNSGCWCYRWFGLKPLGRKYLVAVNLLDKTGWSFFHIFSGLAFFWANVRLKFCEVFNNPSCSPQTPMLISHFVLSSVCPACSMGCIFPIFSRNRHPSHTKRLEGKSVHLKTSEHATFSWLLFPTLPHPSPP